MTRKTLTLALVALALHAAPAAATGYMKYDAIDGEFQSGGPAPTQQELKELDAAAKGRR